ncbi:MAG: HdeD family acid-resistance protein [Opitutales bacterium]
MITQDASPAIRLPGVLNRTPEQIKSQTRWTLTLGVVLAIVGLLALILPFIASVVTSLVVGVALLIGGALQAVSAGSVKGAKHGWVPIATGVLAAFAGILILVNPFEGMAALTIVLGVVFFVSGVLRLIHVVPFHTAGVRSSTLNIVSGILGIVIALLIWTGWPVSALWFIGILVGVELLFAGLALITFGIVVKRETQ